jgi:hypothetical protein
MVSSIFDTFGQDSSEERSGISVDYGDVRFLIARAGGSNTNFQRVFRARAKPYRHQIDNELMSDEASEKLMAQVYAETVILRIDTLKKDENGEPVKDSKGQQVWELNTIPTREGETVPFDVPNTVALLLDLKDLFKDIQVMATKVSNFRKQEEAADEGNSKKS